MNDILDSTTVPADDTAQPSQGASAPPADPSLNEYVEDLTKTEENLVVPSEPSPPPPPLPMDKPKKSGQGGHKIPVVAISLLFALLTTGLVFVFVNQQSTLNDIRNQAMDGLYPGGEKCNAMKGRCTSPGTASQLASSCRLGAQDCSSGEMCVDEACLGGAPGSICSTLGGICKEQGIASTCSEKMGAQDCLSGEVCVGHCPNLCGHDGEMPVGGVCCTGLWRDTKGTATPNDDICSATRVEACHSLGGECYSPSSPTILPCVNNQIACDKLGAQDCPADELCYRITNPTTTPTPVDKCAYNSGDCYSRFDHTKNPTCINNQRCYIEVNDWYCPKPAGAATCNECGFAGPAGNEPGMCIVRFDERQLCEPAICNEETTAPTPTPTRVPTNTPTSTPIVAQCTNIKIYKDGVVVTPSTLKTGDAVVIAVTGGNATKARVRVNGGSWTETTNKNSAGEYTVNYTLPSGVTDFTVQSEIYGLDNAWH